MAQQQQQQQQQPGYAAPGLGGLGGLGGGGPNMDALRGGPQVDRLRELVAQNPALLQPMIQELAATNPQIAQSIAQNPDLLFQLLNNPSLGEGEEGDLVPPGAHVIQVTPEERDAIARVRLFFCILQLLLRRHIYSWRL